MRRTARLLLALAAILALAFVGLGVPAEAARPVTNPPTITAVATPTHVGPQQWSDGTYGCRVSITATLANVPKGRYYVLFQVHSVQYGWGWWSQEPLTAGQTSVSNRLAITTCTVDGAVRDQVRVQLFNNGRLIDSKAAYFASPWTCGP